ncbi:MAG TPA: flagellar hook-basal body complex protein [Gallionella sp.]|jgi:flagellar hook protein FlgE|nr:flagellar hook-basal body complex protein [Gallionella sp.]
MSFQQGLSGLNLSSKQLDVIGNNVANSGTVGFKQSQAQFADMYATSLAGSGAVQVGTGGKVAAVVQQFTQGNVSNTSNPMDIAISGQGFFRMIDQSGSILYSRNGQFQVDKNGFVINNQGHILSGYLPNATGAIIPGQPLPIQLNSSDLSPRQTAGIAVGVNLDSRTATPTTPAFDPVDPTTYNSSTSLTVYDSLGAGHVESLYFARQPIAATDAPAIILAGETAATLTSAANMSVGNTITIAGAGVAGADLTTTITAIAGNLVSFAPATSTATAAGAIVTSNAGSSSWNTYMTIDGVLVPASTTGANPPAVPNTTTTMELAAVPAGLAAGGLITIAGAGPNGTTHTATITGIAAGVVTFAPPASTAPGNGVIVTSPLAQLTFDTLGQLSATAPTSSPLGTMASAIFTPTGADPQSLSLNFASSSQYSGVFGVNSLTQDGYSSGRLSGFNTSDDGTILGRYTNGQSRALGQVLLANFTNPQGLQPMGNNEWVESSTSGSPLIGTPGSSSLGILQSSAVEDSNVDLTAELVNMITAQRAYQANAQTIKAQDAVLQTLVNLR